MPLHKELCLPFLPPGCIQPNPAALAHCRPAELPIVVNVFGNGDLLLRSPLAVQVAADMVSVGSCLEQIRNSARGTDPTLQWAEYLFTLSGVSLLLWYIQPRSDLVVLYEVSSRSMLGSHTLCQMKHSLLTLRPPLPHTHTFRLVSSRLVVDTRLPSA